MSRHACRHRVVDRAAGARSAGGEVEDCAAQSWRSNGRRSIVARRRSIVARRRRSRTLGPSRNGDAGPAAAGALDGFGCCRRIAAGLRKARGLNGARTLPRRN